MFSAHVDDCPRFPRVTALALKCYNLGLQMMEMGRPAEAERFVGKALGLVKLGSSKAFADRWEETIFQVCARRVRC